MGRPNFNSPALMAAGRRLTGGASGQGAFHTFVNHVREQFEPELNDEHTDHVWAHPDNPPEPLHPGVANLFGASGKGPLAKDAREFEHGAHR